MEISSRYLLMSHPSHFFFCCLVFFVFLFIPELDNHQSLVLSGYTFSLKNNTVQHQKMFIPPPPSPPHTKCEPGDSPRTLRIFTNPSSRRKNSYKCFFFYLSSCSTASSTVSSPCFTINISVTRSSSPIVILLAGRSPPAIGLVTSMSLTLLVS